MDWPIFDSFFWNKTHIQEPKAAQILTKNTFLDIRVRKAVLDNCALGPPIFLCTAVLSSQLCVFVIFAILFVFFLLRGPISPLEIH